MNNYEKKIYQRLDSPTKWLIANFLSWLNTIICLICAGDSYRILLKSIAHIPLKTEFALGGVHLQHVGIGDMKFSHWGSRPIRGKFVLQWNTGRPNAKPHRPNAKLQGPSASHGHVHLMFLVSISFAVFGGIWAIENNLWTSH